MNHLCKSKQEYFFKVFSCDLSLRCEEEMCVSKSQVRREESGAKSSQNEENDQVSTPDCPCLSRQLRDKTSEKQPELLHSDRRTSALSDADVFLLFVLS